MNKIIKAVAAMALALPMVQSVHAQLKASKPNIILVMTDDQGYGDLGCHGHPFIKTPNLDKLYTRSLRFTDYHASPTCAPTRAALMSGNAPFKNGITHTILERERMTLKTTTVAQTPLLKVICFILICSFDRQQYSTSNKKRTGRNHSQF